MTSHRSFCLAILSSLAFVLGPLYGDDWPTYLHDNARSGVTAEVLDLPLSEQWAFTAREAPVPAWPDPQPVPVEGFLELPRMRFDDAYHVAVADGAVYFSSSADHKVYSLEASTGKLRWSHSCGGPVRLAPTVHEGRVLVGSDDGYVRCLDADNGEVIWKFQAAPSDEQVLGRGKMISLWPCRTGVLVDEGMAYFGAGVFPGERVYLYAVRADNGSLIWKNDTVSDLSAGQQGFSPQGYLLASPTMLFAPSGRSLPAAFDRKDGRFLYQRGYGWRSVGTIGGTYALLAGEHLFGGTDLVVGYEQQSGNIGFAWFPGRRLIVTGDASYMLSDQGLSALDRRRYPKATSKRRELKTKRDALLTAKPADLKDQLQALEEEEKANEAVLASCQLWQNELAGLESMILAGDVLLAGGQDQVLALDAATGQTRWSAKVKGTAKGLAVADGRLFVSTDRGTIHCFEKSASAPARPGQSPGPADASLPTVTDPYPEDQLTPLYQAAANAIVEETGIKRGYCLVLGCGTGRLAFELAERTDLTIYGIEPDAVQVAQARQALDAAGLYGTRVSVDQGSLSSLPYSDCFANLIVSDDALISGQLPGSAPEAYRVLKPLGGTVFVGQPAEPARIGQPLPAAPLRQWLSAMGGGHLRLTRRHGLWGKLVRGPLEGAGSWTHQYGDAGNTASSEDRLLKCPLGVLWYGEPGPADAVNRHLGTAAPLSINGRVFLQGLDDIICFDAYNGVQYWRRRVEGAYRVGMVVECGNLAATEDSLFVATGKQCLRLDAATGQTRATYEVPGQERSWGYVAVVDNLLFGSTSAKPRWSDSVFAVDIDSGTRRWVHQGESIRNNTICVSDGRMLFADDAVTPKQSRAALEQKLEELMMKGLDTAAAEQELKAADVRMVVALDAKTGAQLWERPVDLTDCGGMVLSAICKDGVLLFCGAHSNGHYWTQFLRGDYASRRVTALDASDGSPLWSKAIGYRIRPLVIGDTLYAEPWAFDLRTGEQKMRVHPLTGRPSKWEFERPGHHCGTISGSPNGLYFRSGCTGYYDLVKDEGTNHFGGQRPGCWINMIPANGLLIEPEASSGCVCLYSLTCTVVFEPRETSKAWGIYDAPGDTTPVKHLALNLGGPGDRRDEQGTLWLSFPRPWGRMRLDLPVGVTQLPEGGYFNQAAEHVQVAGADTPWLFASGCSGITRCVVPLVGEDDGPAVYTVRLGFDDTENETPGQRVFDIKLQGKVVEENFDIVRAAGGRSKAVFREFAGIEVSGDLVIELVPTVDRPTRAQAPLLNSLEITRTQALQVGLGTPSFVLSDAAPQQSGVIKITNCKDSEFLGVIRLGAPDGFHVEPIEKDVQVAPNSEMTLPVTASVAEPRDPGDYHIAVALVRPDGTAESERRARVEYLGSRRRVVVKATGDAYVSHASPRTNFSQSASLSVDGGDVRMGDHYHSIGYLKFPVQIAGKSVSVTLRIHTAVADNSQSSDSGTIRLADGAWDENSIIYDNRPQAGREVAKLGAVQRDAWVERPLNVELEGKTELSLVLEPTTCDGASYESREGADAPELVIDYQPAD